MENSKITFLRFALLLSFASACYCSLSSQTVGPLLSTRWSQGCYYNPDCPADAAGPCSHVVTGCGATGLAQLLRYHNWPPAGTGSNTYTWAPYGSLTANFGSTLYNWPGMPNTLSGPAPAVAQLLYHCGVALEMMYGPGGSASYFSNQATALKEYFRYSLDMRSLMKWGYTDSAWANLLKTEMLANRPVLYYGTATQGHLWVVDGYRSTPSEQFHMNWGWGGLYDGWYELSNMNPGSAHYTSTGMLIGIRPAAALELNPDTLHVSASVSNPVFQLSTDSAWTCNSSQPWAVPAASSGSAGYSVQNVAVSANPLWVSRSAIIHLNRGNVSDSVVIIQDAVTPSLSVSPTLFTTGFASGSQSITLTCDSIWQASTSDTWLSMVPASGSGNGSFMISFTANPSVNARTGTVVVERGSISRTITVYQNGSGSLWCVPVVVTAGNNVGTNHVTLNTINRLTVQNEGYVLTTDSTQLWRDSTYNLCVNMVGMVSPAVWIDYNIDGDFLDAGEAIVPPSSPWYPSYNINRCTTFTVPSTAAEGYTRMRVYVKAFAQTQVQGPCNLADGGDVEDYVIYIRDPRHLEVTPSPLSFTSAGGTQVLNVSCDSTWSLVSFPAWLSASPSGGTGNGSVNVTVPANPSTLALSGNMQFTRGTFVRNVPVSQAGADTLLDAAPDTIYASSIANLYSTSVSSNVSWQASTAASWFTISTNAGTGNHVVDITPQQNLSFTQRTDSIRFWAGTHQKIVYVIQDSASSVLSVVPSPLIFPWEGGTDSLTVTTGAGWTASINDPWVSISQNSGTGNAIVHVSADTNFITVGRTTTIDFTNGLVTVTVTVIQDPADTLLELHPDTLFVPQTGGTLNLMADANVNFSVSTAAGWASPSNMNGTWDTTFVVSFTDNLGFTQRIDSFVAVSGTHHSTTVIVQDSNSSNMYVNPNVLNFVITGGTQNAMLYTNGNWSTTISDPRIQLSPVSGTDTTLLSVTTADNTGNAPWSGTVTFSNGVQSCVLTVNQDGGNFVLGSGNEVKLWPNPMNGETVQIELSRNADVRFRLYDLRGREVRNLNVTQSGDRLYRISGIPGPGAWLLEVSEGESKLLLRLIRN